MYKKGNIVRRTDESGEETIYTIKEDYDEELFTYVTMEDEDQTEWMYTPDEIELVAESLKALEKATNPQPMEEQTIAIVSFEGAVKREVKALREAIQLCDSVSYFYLNISASGPVNDGEVKIEYRISDSSYGSGGVEGNNVKECLAEFLRRHGWDRVNKPKAISYDGIPT